MTKVNLLVVFVTLGVLAWVIPAQTARAATFGTAAISQQEEPAEPVTQESAAQTFTGQIMQQDRKYVLQGEDNKIYQLDDQERAKNFEGKSVRVTGTLEEESSTIHITDVEEIEE
ncbi:MAG: DUF5818 domain-containing protein [Acidobacteria bacterium]|nr:DUF5818 domain-containing protein [Acidobacteriota bacterium]